MRADVVIAARRWIGTPYRHQASTLGAGCDCLGLIRGVWRALYDAEPEVPPAYTPDWSEQGRMEVLEAAARRHLIAAPFDCAELGDVLLFRLREGAVAKHLGIQSEIGRAPRLIHAYSGHGVVESPLSPSWSRRAVARFRFPPLTSPIGG